MKIGDILPNKEINFPASSRCHVPVWIHNSSRPGESGEKSCCNEGCEEIIIPRG